MQRFYFDLRSGNTWTVDATGEVFADVASAGDAALDVLQSVVRDERAGAGTQEFATRVRDGSDRPVFEAIITLGAQDVLE